MQTTKIGVYSTAIAQKSTSVKQEQSNITSRVFGWIELAEKALLFVLLLGLPLHALAFAIGKTLLLVSLLGICVVWFLLSFKPLDIFSSQEEADAYGQRGFAELLGWTLLPKVLWIGSAISVCGLFAFLVDAKGYMMLITNGAFSIGICLVVAVGLLAMGLKKLHILVPILLRAVAVLLLDMYVLFFL